MSQFIKNKNAFAPKRPNVAPRKKIPQVSVQNKVQVEVPSTQQQEVLQQEPVLQTSEIQQAPALIPVTDKSLNSTNGLSMKELCHPRFSYVGANAMEASKVRRATKRRKIAEAKDAEQAEEVSSDSDGTQTETEQEGAINKQAAQVRVVDGQILVDHEQVEEATVVADEEVVEEQEQDRNTTSASYQTWQKTKRWTPEDTQLFFDGLSVFGTDFEMIAQCIFKNNRNRRAIKLKFNKEERSDSALIDAAMKQRKTLADLNL